ncbi:MarR family transcriptional regulator [Halobacteriales archaeon QS_4_69_225]|nr:MAG: MarR family transcriptional regulator [Halobacteriales archaeon QS_4_69_225]
MSSGTIDIDEFENADANEFERLGLETDAVSAILSRLKERGLVRHKRPYWAITDDRERLQSAYRLHRHYENADEQYGEERLEELQTDKMEGVQ